MQRNRVRKRLHAMRAIDVEEPLDLGVELVHVVSEDVLISLEIVLEDELVVEDPYELEHGPILKALVIVGFGIGIDHNQDFPLVHGPFFPIEDDILFGEFRSDYPDVDLKAHIIRDFLPRRDLPLDERAVWLVELVFLKRFLVVSLVVEVIVDGAEQLMRLERPFVAEAKVIDKYAVVAHLMHPCAIAVLVDARLHLELLGDDSLKFEHGRIVHLIPMGKQKPLEDDIAIQEFS